MYKDTFHTKSEFVYPFNKLTLKYKKIKHRYIYYMETKMVLKFENILYYSLFHVITCNLIRNIFRIRKLYLFS